jgi:hypothetical protein
MNEELIQSIAKLLQEWNPLGGRASNVKDLEEYRYEAIDILSSISITKYSVRDSVSNVLSEAFNLELDESKLSHYSEKIEDLLNEE